MKLLQNALLESLSSAISVQGDNIVINGSLDSYSCKMTGNDKKLYKHLNTQGHSPSELKALSPSESQQQLIYGFSPNSMYTAQKHTQMECPEVGLEFFIVMLGLEGPVRGWRGENMDNSNLSLDFSLYGKF